VAAPTEALVGVEAIDADGIMVVSNSAAASSAGERLRARI